MWKQHDYPLLMAPRGFACNYIIRECKKRIMRGSHKSQLAADACLVLLSTAILWIKVIFKAFPSDCDILILLHIHVQAGSSQSALVPDDMYSRRKRASSYSPSTSAYHLCFSSGVGWRDQN